MADSSSCLTATCNLPLHHVLNWSPFNIDALGIITMIGAEQVDASIGRLVRSRFTEYLPLLGAFIFASDQFADARSGYAVYNLTAGITTTAIAGWFSRWCAMQQFETSNSVVHWEMDTTVRKGREWLNRPQRRDVILATCIGFIINAFVLAFTVLQGDWWGLANAVSMTISVAVRYYAIKENRDALDTAVEGVSKKSNHDATKEKILVILSDATMVTMYVPSGITYACFVTKPEIKNKRAYYGMRMMGWAGFTIQVITLGMSGLATQIITVFLMVVSTVAVHFRVGCDDHIVGTRLRAKRDTFGKNRSRRRDVYAALRLSPHEEDCMLAWNLMPHKTSPGAEDWWEDYREKKKRYEQEYPIVGGEKGSAQEFDTKDCPV